MRDHVARVDELDTYLERFPKNKDGDAVSKIEEDEIMDLLELGTPNKWQKQMILHGFDPIASTQKELIDFCERLERTEDFEFSDATQVVSQKRDEGGSKKKKAKRNHFSDASQHEQKQKCCTLHGKNNTHTSDECHKLKAMADEEKNK